MNRRHEAGQVAILFSASGGAKKSGKEAGEERTLKTAPSAAALLLALAATTILTPIAPAAAQTPANDETGLVSFESDAHLAAFLKRLIEDAGSFPAPLPPPPAARL